MSMAEGMGKAVEVIWSLTPFRSDEFVEQWIPYAALAINYGAKGYLLVRQADDELIVKQYAFFDKKSDWDRYWNSEALQQGRAKLMGRYVVPLLYTWQEVHAHGHVTDASDESAVAASADA
ncbi:MAG: hypothetical protein JJE27_06210 [Thermoleophilia bacterium]|nr:hypothetical protein [Thermoleophilia bacterium]